MTLKNEAAILALPSQDFKISYNREQLFYIVFQNIINVLLYLNQINTALVYE